MLLIRSLLLIDGAALFSSQNSLLNGNSPVQEQAGKLNNCLKSAVVKVPLVDGCNSCVQQPEQSEW